MGTTTTTTTTTTGTGTTSINTFTTTTTTTTTVDNSNPITSTTTTAGTTSTGVVTTTKGPNVPPPPSPAPPSDKLLRCYHKYALDDSEPALRYCSPGDDICVISFLKHEDGHHHTSQFCSNSSLESWWGGNYQPCTYGDMGGYQCACTSIGCNVDGETAGFLPMEKRMRKILF